ncbi:MAG: DegT/DnrJ/EryC1/StrS family aminotransferase [Elusimicrobia bacterium]|nr:DegT/DnrJ/EryC1/StrS family aminotransferase [Elusimicrobiota bacterium]
MKIPLLDLKEQYAGLREELLEAAKRVMDSGAFINGPEGRAFEAEFASAMGAPHCAGVSNGTDAIELSLKACGVGPGHEVAVPAFTFIATASAVCSIGARPLFVDIDEKTFAIDPAALKRNLTRKTKAVIPVHLFGWPADMDAILEAARPAGLKVVEDCAQAHGALYKGRGVGGFGDAGAFSFYPTKNMGALGDAGAIVTRDAELHQAVLSLRDAGRSPGERYIHAVPGRNARLDELQAAFLRVKLKRLAEWNVARERAASVYRKELAGLPLGLPPENSGGTRHVYHLFVVRSKRRDELAARLLKADIHTALYYPVPLHRQPAFRDYGLQEGAFPVSERACREVLALPMYPELGEERARRVAGEIRRFYSS